MSSMPERSQGSQVHGEEEDLFICPTLTAPDVALQCYLSNKPGNVAPASTQGRKRQPHVDSCRFLCQELHHDQLSFCARLVAGGYFGLMSVALKKNGFGRTSKFKCYLKVNVLLIMVPSFISSSFLSVGFSFFLFTVTKDFGLVASGFSVQDGNGLYKPGSWFSTVTTVERGRIDTTAIKEDEDL